MSKNNKHEEDIVIEEEFNNEKTDKKIKKLREDLKNCQKEKQEYLIGWQRSQADYINLKKRLEIEKEESREKILISFIEDLIPAIDSFEMALKNKDKWESISEDWRMGMEYIFNQLKKILDENNIKTIDPLNQEFDHLKHNCIKQLETSDKEEDNKVTEVLQKGYEIGPKIIRPAQVIVSVFEKNNSLQED